MSSLRSPSVSLLSFRRLAAQLAVRMCGAARAALSFICIARILSVRLDDQWMLDERAIDRYEAEFFNAALR